MKGVVTSLMVKKIYSHYSSLESIIFLLYDEGKPYGKFMMFLSVTMPTKVIKYVYSCFMYMCHILWYLKTTFHLLKNSY